MFNRLSKHLLVLSAFLALALSPLAAEAASTLTLVNNSSSQLDGVYISDSGENDWEENLIDGYILPPGNEIDIRIQGSYRLFDLRVESVDGGYEDYYEFPGNTTRIVIRGGGQSSYR